jgi:hypothetical protein
MNETASELSYAKVPLLVMVQLAQKKCVASVQFYPHQVVLQVHE